MPEQKLFGGKVPDPSTQKILDELEEEPEAGASGSEEGNGGEPTPKTTEGDEPAGKKKETPATTGAESKPTKGSEEEPEAGEEGGKSGEEGREPFEPRKPQMVPLSKLQKAKETWKEREQELLKELETAREGKNGTSASELEAIAKKHSIDVDLLKDLGDAFRESLPDNSELATTVKTIVSQQRDRQQDQKFDTELASFAKNIPEAAALRDQLHELAFSETSIEIDGQMYQSYQLPIRFLYEHLSAKKPLAKPSVEAGAGGRGRTNSATDKPISEMTDAEFEEYSNRKAKEQGGTLSRISHRQKA